VISIGLPAYKARFLEQAIESVLKQTFVDFELIIVNDASPENLKDIVCKFNDPRIRYYENDKNIGAESVVKNWNKVLSFAKGEYFVLFSDDDIMEKDYLTKMLESIKSEPNYNVYRCRVNVINSKNETLATSPESPIWETALDYIIQRLKGNRQHYISEVIFKRSRLVEIGGFVDFPLAWYSDEATCFLAGFDTGIYFVNEILFNWRYSDSNLSKIGNYLKRIEAGLQYKEWLIKIVKENYNKNIYENISKLANSRIEQNKKNVLIRTARRNIFLGTLEIFINGLTVRKKFGMSYYLIGMAILSFIKNYSRGKN